MNQELPEYQSEVNKKYLAGVDYARLSENERIELEEIKKTKSFERLIESDFWTGEEHFWIAGSSDYQYAYPLTPYALLLFPDRLGDVNRKRKERGEMRTYLLTSGGIITPNPLSLGYEGAFLSIEPINSVTGERGGLPKVTGVIDQSRNIVRDEEIINKFRYDPDALKKIVVSHFTRRLSEIQERLTQNEYTDFEKNNMIREGEGLRKKLEEFLRYY